MHTQTTSTPNRQSPLGFPGNTFERPFVVNGPPGFPANTFERPFVIDGPPGFPGNTLKRPFVIDGPPGFPGNTLEQPYVIDQIHIYCTDAAFPSSPAEVKVGEVNAPQNDLGHQNVSQPQIQHSRNDFVVYHRMTSLPANSIHVQVYHEPSESNNTKKEESTAPSAQNL
ncbi:hypothetical protein PTTG_08798 [Puccinia triticina 1-1 BBBD Race 1]|uniref:Uncharacterized protein n=2 Tax=Puccinia triticina TaxID=208348 RepID=A0A180GID6_PUCT1|nr:uncharacterized protein PtA15_18A419 [Puccinia triticina]OAV92082.1 hypothetical protein PTTG_08798 [Puccinia triticina 1-1 BBBD Race 1]WAQ93359.1 hypothetical protein PtA15_18A419 [Puccinia triticina]WAR63360.1 hypothetical protein PtB15_18B443 [Puccinia triticina]